MDSLILQMHCVHKDLSISDVLQGSGNLPVCAQALESGGL